jgi:chitodextrinase
VTGYRVSRNGSVLGTVTTTQYNDSGLTPGATYTYTVVALDAAGNESAAATRSHTQPVPDTTPPSAPASFRTTSLTKAKVTFAWNASSDNVAVAGYRVYRNGALVATVTGTTWSHSRQKTASTYHVVAYDAAGNVSGASNTVTVPKR